MLFKLAFHSLINRKATVILTIASIAISLAIVLSIEHIRQQAKTSFTSTLSGTDLIVGARSGRINLLLYSVFRMGNATNNISWQSYQKVAQQKGVRWTIPLSLGDSHKSYRVLGTTQDYFTYYRYGQKQTLTFDQGEIFSGVYDVVLGSEVANKLGYQLAQKIVLSHGMADVSFTQHDDKPFTVIGILKATGTPVDQTVHISLAGMEAIHIDWQNGAPVGGLKIDAATALTKDLSPKNITAFLLGLDNKIMTFRLQRQINEYKGEPLLAILPGVALSELWQIMGVVEKVLALIAALVMLASLLGMTTMMLATLSQRQREIAVLRATGASAGFIFCLIELEILLITFMGIILGLALLWLLMICAQPFIMNYYGILLSSNPLNSNIALYVIVIILVTSLLACVPSGLAYRHSLSRGLMNRE
ncbi:MAG: putative ABC transport system permease protein [Cellvibrionaceae bacterium]|jgi:putative ABC transport system permease protein